MKLLKSNAMEPWIRLLFSYSFLLLHGEAPVLAAELQLPSSLECCHDGRARALVHLDCTIIPRISTSHICRIAQEQCCENVVSEELCSSGITMGKGQRACERYFFQGQPWETRISKMCCDCCLLGLTAAGRREGCDLGLLLGRQCEHAANVCCGKNNTLETKPATQAPLLETPPTTPPTTLQPPEETGSCIGNDTCICHDGYQQEADGLNCEDVNECLSGTHSCVPGQLCINTQGSFRCQRETNCGTGYELTDHNDCLDIDECALGSHNCGADFLCTNTAGSFRCRPKETCGDGFIQDAAGSCIDINECVALSSPCLMGQTCLNTMGSFTCRQTNVTCRRGYHLNEQGTRCHDVDECRAGGVCGDHGCVNLVGSYRCECRAGFVFNGITRLCEDINECRHYPGRLCAHKCDNTEGSYQCSCTRGFQLAHDGRNCEDLDECVANPCSQECANVYGSYQCYCRRGYQLSDIDGITCEDIDECALPAGGHVCSYICTNAPGSFYCTCPDGYTLTPNGRTCQDIDECAMGSHTCSGAQSCFNLQGEFRCLFFECPDNFLPAAQSPLDNGSVNVRCVKVCQPGDMACDLEPVRLITHTVLSLPHFREISQPEELVFLKTTAPVNPAPYSGATEVYFDIITVDEERSFDVVKRSHYNLIMGVVCQTKPILGPRELVVEVAMTYVNSGVISHRNVVIIHVFVSKFWF